MLRAGLVGALLGLLTPLLVVQATWAVDAPGGAVELATGWQIRSSATLRAPGRVISDPAYPTAGWLPISKPETLAHARAVSEHLRTALSALQAAYSDLVLEIRGKGLLVGLKLKPNNREFMAAARDHGVLVAGGGENCVRLLPPLILSFAEADEIVRRLEATCVATRAVLAEVA